MLLSDLCITCIFFATKLQHRVSWRLPKSLSPTGPGHHKKSLAKLRPHSYHSTSCDTDHSLICSMVRPQPKRNHRSKQRECPRINTASRTIPDLCERFAKSIEAAIHDCPTERWNHTHDPSYNSAMDAFGKREGWNHTHDPSYNSAMDAFGKRERQNPDRLELGVSNSKQSSQPKERRCSALRGSLQRRQSLHSRRPEITLSG